ncbi:MAG: PTS sugar transporter subunit IIC [Erysipelotrichaceae bacterium]|nr:PTS sugar transporter subunit IIC [Erysipelotrichaceae bacterium]
MGKLTLCEVLKLDVYYLISLAVSPLINIVQSLFGMTLLVFLMSFFYSFGISPWILQPVYYAVGLDALAKNAALVAAGSRPENVMTVETISGWTMIGGTGCTLTLCMLFFFCRSAKLKGLAKSCIVPSIFNINEPIVYGAIVFNPLLMIPMWLNAIAVSVITYLTMKAGLVTMPYRSFLLWYVPEPILPFMTNYDFRGVILVLILMVINAVIWYPFLLIYDRQCLKQEETEKEA